MTGDDAFDALIVGGGHNGLICAAYLARASLSVCVAEKNERCGGALFSTRSNGVTLEHGGIEHSAILASPIAEELRLEDCGLRYRCHAEGPMHLFGDGVRIPMAATPEETAAAIASVDEADADAWLELAALSQRLIELTAELSCGWTPPLEWASRIGRSALGGSGRSLPDLATASVIDLAQEWFRSPHVRSLAVFRSGFSGLPAWAPGTAAVFCLTPGSPGRATGRPVGGSAAFVASLERAVRSAGGEIRTEFEVSAVTPTAGTPTPGGTGAGGTGAAGTGAAGTTASGSRASGSRRGGWTARSAGGEQIRCSRALISALPPQDFVTRLLDPAAVPRSLFRRFASVATVSGNLSQFTLAVRLTRRPDLGALGAHAGSMLWLAAAPRHVLASQAAAITGAIASRPAVLVTFPSVADPSLADEPQSTMWVNGFLAKDLSGRSWPEAVPEASESIWATVESCLPGVRRLAAQEVFTSPADLTARTGAANPGAHVALTLDQLLSGRPVRGASRHRSGIPGVYLTGAGTNPGPGISGLPGRACAQAVLADLGASGPLPRLRRAPGAVRREWTRLRSAASALRQPCHSSEAALTQP